MSIRTKHEWIKRLAAESNLIADMRLESLVKDADLSKDAFNLSNCDDHCHLVTRVMQEILTNDLSSKENARNLLRNLIERNTYGAFAELAAYDWLTCRYIRIATQVDMTSSDVLAAKGSTLDGRIEHSGTYFDVKAFGFNGRLAQRLKERLEQEIPDMQIHIE